MILTGKIWRYSDNVDTDVIIPARYLNTSDPTELAVHCMEDIDPTFAKNVAAGDIIVAGRNFGCGSSREHAPIAIKASGVSCVIAESFARIFFRNAVNIGLPVIELGNVAEAKFSQGDIVEADFDEGTVTNKTTGNTYKVSPVPKFIQDIAAAGGLIQYVKAVPNE